MECRQDITMVNLEEYAARLTQLEKADRVAAYIYAIDTLLAHDLKSQAAKDITKINVSHFGFAGVCTPVHTRHLEFIFALKWILEHNADWSGIELMNAYYYQKKNPDLMSKAYSFFLSPPKLLNCVNGEAEFLGKTFDEFLESFPASANLTTEQMQKSYAGAMLLLERYNYPVNTIAVVPQLGGR